MYVVFEGSQQTMDMGLVVSCVAACCQAAPLTDLSVTLEGDVPELPTLGWLLPTQHSLHQLTMEGHLRSFHFDIPLQQFAALAKMRFWCSDLSFARDCCLPSSLTSLEMCWLDGLPPEVRRSSSFVDGCICCTPLRALIIPPHDQGLQIFAAPRLACLELASCECWLKEHDDLQPVAAPITSLVLRNSNAFQDVLMALPQLLYLDNCRWPKISNGGAPDQAGDAAATEQLGASLSALNKLTCLSLEWPTAPPLMEVSCLTNLRLLRVRYSGPAPPPVRGLPSPGAWCRGLLELSIPCSIALKPSSLEALRGGMPALKRLQLLCRTADCTHAKASAWETLLDSVEGMPSLHYLDIVRGHSI